MTNILNAKRINQITAFLKSLNIKSKRFSEIIRTQNISIIQDFNQAFTHSSEDTILNYEKLEFFGDAVLRLAASNFIEKKYPQMSVGERSELRAQIVSDEWLTKLGEKVLGIFNAGFENLKIIEVGNSKFIDQDNSKVTYAKKIDKKETKINWYLEANKLLGHIHGLSPNPGAWFEYESERFKVLRVKISLENGKPGLVLDENLTIGCRSGSIQILELQRQGKNKQTTKEFLLGSKINKGKILI